MDNMIFTSEVCGVVLIAPFDKISRPPCSTIRFIVFLSLFFRCFYPFFLYHRIFLLTVPIQLASVFKTQGGSRTRNLRGVAPRRIHDCYSQSLWHTLWNILVHRCEGPKPNHIHKKLCKHRIPKSASVFTEKKLRTHFRVRNFAVL